MKQFSITKSALRVFVDRLEGRGDGYNIKQLRLLDRVITTSESALGDYSKRIDALIDQAKIDATAHPESISEINETINDKLNEITENEGKDVVIVILEDEQYEFIKEIWDNLAGYRGNSEVRKLIIEADDAINSAKPYTPSVTN